MNVLNIAMDFQTVGRGIDKNIRWGKIPVLCYAIKPGVLNNSQHPLDKCTKHARLLFDNAEKDREGYSCYS